LAAVAKKIIEAVDQPCRVASVELQTSLSIGISVFLADGTDAEALLAHADEAMYCAKQRGGNTFQFFAAGMNAFTPVRLELENDLRRALPLQQFELYYQPKVDVTSGRIASVEALIRWHHPVEGMICSDAFIPLDDPRGDRPLHFGAAQPQALGGNCGGNSPACPSEFFCYSGAYFTTSISSLATSNLLFSQYLQSGCTSPRENCPVRIRWASSMPANVIAALPKD
jgi:hypothetical protein